VSDSNLSDQLTRAGKYAKAVDQARKAVELNPGNTSARVNLAAAYLLAGQAEEIPHVAWLELQEYGQHSQVRKAIRNKGHFPSDEAATKLIYLALRNIMAKWKRPPKEWHAAKAQLAIQFGDRFTMAA
jgi:predicted Zn-dependent protease